MSPIIFEQKETFSEVYILNVKSALEKLAVIIRIYHARPADYSNPEVFITKQT